MQRRMLSTFLATCLLFSVLIASGAAMADTWSPIASGGIEGHFNEMQREVGCMVEFNSKLYVGTTNLGTGCEVWCYSGGTWTKVSNSGFAGPGAYVTTTGVLSMFVYGSYLYVATEDASRGCQVWRTAGTGGPPYTDWVQVNVNGFGDIDNRKGLSMAVFDSYLYVGTNNWFGGGCEVWRSSMSGGTPFTDWTLVNSNGFGDSNNADACSMAVFGSYLYVGTNNNNGCQVWRTDGTGSPITWTRVNGDGFGGDNNNRRALSMLVNGTYLYVGTDNWNDGCEIWRTAASGGLPFTDWTQVNSDGFGDNRNDYAESLAMYNGYLYASTYNYYTGGQVWRSHLAGDPPFSDWAQVNAGGFGDINNSYVAHLAVFGSYLYAGTANASTGCEVWWTAAGGGPPFTDWTQVNIDGFSLNANRGASSFVLFGNDLYVGTTNWSTGCQVWRCHAGAWERVDTHWLGDGSGIDAYRMTVMGPYLYVATSKSFGGCEVWRTAGAGGPPFTDWVQVNADGFGSSDNTYAYSMMAFGSYLYVGTGNDTTGCELWRTAATTGTPFTDWEQVNLDGFNDPNNLRACSMAEFDSHLYVGTWNPYDGCEVWRTAGVVGVPPLFSDWEKVNLNGFDGTSGNGSVMSMAAFGSKLYMGTGNGGSGCEVWCTSTTDVLPFTDWTQVNQDGFEEHNKTDKALSMAVFDSQLYVGTSGWDTGCEVWKSAGDGGPPYTDWTKTNTDGFGDIETTAVPAMLADGYRLYAGTSNKASGCQVMRTLAMPTTTSATTSGAVGAYVTIDGANFGNSRDTSYVSFGSTQAQPSDYLSWGPGQVLCKVPEGASGQLQLTVTTDGGTSNPQNFAVSPAITSITPNSGTQGATVDVTNLAGTGFYGTPTVKLLRTGFTDIAATNVTAVSSTRISCRFTLPTNAAVGQWNLFAQNPDGQNATKTGTFTVAINTYRVNASVSGGGGTVSPGTQDVNHLGSATININPATGYHTAAVTDNGTPVIPIPTTQYEISNVTRSHGVVATFAINTYKVNASVSGGGGTVTPASQVVNHGGSATININPATGYHTASVTDNGTPETPTPTTSYTSDNVTANHTITATFASNQQPGSTWYLAEGTSAWGFSTYITIENPNTTAVHASINYMTGAGNVSGGTITLPAKSQTTVNPADKLPNKDFSTKVTCTEGRTIAVDRTMSWTGPGAASPEGHSSVGVTSPAKTWYLPEGCSAFGFETWLLIQNPNAATATCTVTYMIEGEGPVTKTHTVPGNSRQIFNMETDIGQKNASIKVVSNIPVIPERAMYRNNKREGHDSIGTTTAANDYFLAEGTTAWGFTTWVLIQNPGSSASDVTITYMTPSGKKVQPSFSLAGNSRKTIKVNDVAGMGNTDFSTQVHGSKPIIAERSMYWDNGTGEACHDSIGMSSAHTTFYLPDGQTSEGRETWTLVQNPNASAVTVEVSYLKAGGGAETLTDSIPANSRMTFNMADKVPSGRASIMVTSKTSGKKIMVERAMYWNNRGAGTDTIGGFSD